MHGVDAFIAHYGKKGMRWGVRRSKASKQTKKLSSDYKKVAEIRKKSPPELSNKQLKIANERINLEQNFSRLNPSKVKRGENKVAALLATATLATSVYNMAKSPAGKAFIEAGKKAIKK